MYGVKETNKDYVINPLDIDYNLVNTPSRYSIISLLSGTPVDIDNLQKHTELPLSVIYTILLELELAGEIMRYPGNKFALLYNVIPA
jgi:predicted Rossmann fold nucleotide-binding protein DprA/Smf involved in DNA uptake